MKKNLQKYIEKRESLIQKWSSPDEILIWLQYGVGVCLVAGPILIVFSPFSNTNVPIIITLIGGFINALLVWDFLMDIQVFNKLTDKIKKEQPDQITENITVKDLNAGIKPTIRFMQMAYIISTVLCAALWFLFSSDGLEPLTILLGSGSALYYYFGSRLGIDLFDWLPKENTNE